MTPDQLEAAAFWQARICLSCEAIVDDDEVDCCQECGSGDLVSAEVAQRCVELIESEER